MFSLGGEGAQTLRVFTDGRFLRSGTHQSFLKELPGFGREEHRAAVLQVSVLSTELIGEVSDVGSWARWRISGIAAGDTQIIHRFTDAVDGPAGPQPQPSPTDGSDFVGEFDDLAAMGDMFMNGFHPCKAKATCRSGTQGGGGIASLRPVVDKSFGVLPSEGDSESSSCFGDYGNASSASDGDLSEDISDLLAKAPQRVRPPKRKVAPCPPPGPPQKAQATPVEIVKAQAASPEADKGKAILAEAVPGAEVGVEVPPPPPSDEQRPPKPARCRAPGDWKRVVLPDGGVLVFDEKSNRLNAHCPAGQHTVGGTHCHTDRLTTPSARARRGFEGQGRPLGFLVAWLRASSQATKTEHQASKKTLGSAEGWHARSEARRWLQSLSESDARIRELFKLERAPTPEEEALGGEPLVVP